MFKIEVYFIDGKKDEWILDKVTKKQKKTLNNMIKMSNVLHFSDTATNTSIYIPRSSVLKITTAEIGE